jgi:hypothetical protein
MSPALPMMRRIGRGGRTGRARASHCLRRREAAGAGGLQAWRGGQPISLTAFHDRAMADYVREVLASGRIGTIYLFSGQMGLCAR